MTELKTKVILVIRWLAILPGSIAAFFLTQVLTTIVITIAYLCGDYLWDWLFRYDQAHQLVNSITGAIAFIWVGTKIAPKYRLVVAIGLTGLFSGFVILSLFVETCLRLTHYPLKWFIIYGLVSVVAAIFTCAEVCRQIVNEVRNKFLSASDC